MVKKTVSTYDPTRLLSFTELVATVNASSRTVQIMIDGGYIIRAKDGMYQLNTSVQGFGRYKSDHGTKKGATKEASSQRVQEARAKQIEQNMAIEAKELISFSEHIDIFDMLFGSIKAELDGLAAQLTRDKTLRVQYQGILDGMMRRLSERWAKMSKDVEGADDEEEDT